MAKNSLHSLIRLRKWDVDEKQRALAVLLRHEEAIIERSAALEAEVAAEMAYTATLPADQRHTLAAYLKRCDEFRAKLAELLAEARRQILNAQGELAEAYRRLKTFEITQTARERADVKEADRLEQIDLNEMGIELYRRKQRPGA